MPVRTWRSFEFEDPHLRIKPSGVMARRMGMRTMATPVINNVRRLTNIDILGWVDSYVIEATLVPNPASL
jgi:hypothetical protein